MAYARSKTTTCSVVDTVRVAPSSDLVLTSADRLIAPFDGHFQNTCVDPTGLQDCSAGIERMFLTIRPNRHPRGQLVTQPVEPNLRERNNVARYVYGQHDVLIGWTPSGFGGRPTRSPRS